MPVVGSAATVSIAATALPADWLAETALYSLTESVRSPFQGEPAHILSIRSLQPGVLGLSLSLAQTFARYVSFGSGFLPI